MMCHVPQIPDCVFIGIMKAMCHRTIVLSVAALGCAFGGVAGAQPSMPGYNDGTDPARPAKTVGISFEGRGLAGNDRQHSLFADFVLPLRSARTVVALRVPMVGVRSAGNDWGPGDVGIQLSRIIPTDERGAIIVGGQLELDTAGSVARGSGQTVASASMIVERVTAIGMILAPTITHSLGISGSAGRVNRTRINLYTVPVHGGEDLYLTLDPAVTFDWGEQARYGEIVATAGYRIGRLAGGDMQLFVRPGVGFGSLRSYRWSVEAGFQLLNF